MSRVIFPQLKRVQVTHALSMYILLEELDTTLLKSTSRLPTSLEVLQTRFNLSVEISKEYCQNYNPNKLKKL